jgi:hypothetical protein
VRDDFEKEREDRKGWINSRHSNISLFCAGTMMGRYQMVIQASAAAAAASLVL